MVSSGNSSPVRSEMRLDSVPPVAYSITICTVPPSMKLFLKEMMLGCLRWASSRISCAISLRSLGESSESGVWNLLITSSSPSIFRRTSFTTAYDPRPKYRSSS